MNKFFLPLIFAACFLSAPALGGVIYNWQQVSASPTISSSSGWLEITDAAWRSGYINFSSNDAIQRCGPSGDSCVLPNSPLLNFQFSVTSENAGYVYLAPRKDLGCEGCSTFGLSIAFSTNGLLSGDIYARDFEANVDMSSSVSQQGLWEIGRFSSDNAGVGCYVGPACYGATGKWVLARTTLPVPEPDVFWLFIFGTLAMFSLAAIRKRRRHMEPLT